jgi:hypothetical protein
MTFKTFNFQNGIESWSNTNGKTLTLYGGIYGYRTPKTFRAVKRIQLVTTAVKPSQIKGDTWTIQATPELMDKCASLFDHEYYHERPELIIEGKGQNIDCIFATMGVSPD